MISIIGIIHQTSFASPKIIQSTAFMDNSIDIIEIKLIPIAVLKALLRSICLDKTIVSRIMLLIIPLIIARSIIDKVGQGIPVSWKNKIVPKSPILQPSKHHAVFLALRLHVCLHFQWKRGFGFPILIVELLLIILI